MNTETISWLIDSHSLLKYRVMKDLIKIDDSSNFKKLENEAFNDPIVKNILAELKQWPGPVLKRHNDAKLLLHKLSFLADMGFTVKDECVKDVTEKILANKTESGVYQVSVNIPIPFGGTGKDQYSWMLCDAPLLLYSLNKLGVDRALLEKGLSYLSNLSLKNGFPCAASQDLGKFNGPGKRGTPCPYANLLMVKLFTLFPEKHSDEKIRNAIEFLLDHWEKRDKRYLFGIGTDFKKLKYPFIWYDILHIAEILSFYPHVKTDKRFLEIVNTIKEKADSQGLYRAESVWMAWKCLDSGQKKLPSKWITFLVYRILNRLAG